MKAPREGLWDAETERAILAVLGNAAVESATLVRELVDQSKLEARHFGVPDHGVVFGAMALLARRNVAPDLLALRAELEGDERYTGRLDALEGFLNAPTAGEHNLPAYSDRVRGLAARRGLLETSRMLATAAYDMQADPLETYEVAITRLGLGATSRRHVLTLTEVLAQVDAEVSAARANPRLRAITTGIPMLDEVIGGLPRNLTFIGALPGVGKSALVATLLRCLAKRGVRVGVFSLEDRAAWLGFRLLAYESDINQYHLLYSDLSNAQQVSLGQGLQRARHYGDNVLVDDRDGLTPQELTASARDFIVNHRCQVLLVDHIGELRYAARGERFDLAMDDALKQLRAVAKSYQVPIVCMSHLRRREGLDPESEPRLTDFANSSAVEKTARLAIALSRARDSDKMTLHILKSTNGRTGRVQLQFEGRAAMVRVADAEIATSPFGESGHE